MSVSSPCLPRCPWDHRSCNAIGIGAIALACLAVYVLSGLVTIEPVRDWYPTINKPSWTPPDWVFGPVWTAIYIVMAVAAVLVWLRRDDCDICGPMGVFAIQLSANLAWSFLFFGLHRIWLGFLDIVLLWAAVGMTVVTFFQIRKLAGWLMAPYWLWVTFAAALNGSIAIMST